MSSVSRAVPSTGTLPYPNNVVTPLYDDGSNNGAPVPFTLTRSGVFDMDFSSGFDTSKSIITNSSTYIRGSSLNALRTVVDIGPNIKAWFVSQESADSADTVTLYKAPVVVKTNILATDLDPNSIDCYDAGFTTPPDFSVAYGDDANNYYSTYLFRTPMVIKYFVSGTANYAIFNTQYEGNT
jgi:hypothetical protein